MLEADNNTKRLPPYPGLQNLIVGLVIVLLLHSALTLQNDVYDIDVDQANKRPTPLTKGLLDASFLREVISYLIFGAIILAWFVQPRLYGLVFCISCSLCGYIYNAPPSRLSRRPILSVVALGLIYALLPLLFGAVLSGQPISLSFYGSVC